MTSCSNVVPVKRVDKIVDAICLLDCNVYWTHYGAGENFEQIKEYAKKLPKNIHYSFKGRVNNADVLKAYAHEDYHLFINLSESEGIPVSIMEAMSFGIPCVATAAGGTREIVEDKVNGALLSTDVSPQQVADVIHEFLNMADTEYQKYRENARATWNSKYNAEINYRAFTDMLYEKAQGVSL